MTGKLDWLVFGLTSVAGRKARINVIMKAPNRSHADRLAAEVAAMAGSAIVLSSGSGLERNSFRVETEFGPVPEHTELQALLPGCIVAQTGPRRTPPRLRTYCEGRIPYLS